VLLRGVAPGEEEEGVCLPFTRNGMDRFLLGWAGAGLAHGLSFGLLCGLLLG
jgi:TM2 domain-containing membrane protein YozV